MPTADFQEGYPDAGLTHICGAEVHHFYNDDA